MASLLFFLAKRYIAGEELKGALERVEQLNKEGLSVILDRLGEDVTDKHEARQATLDTIRITDEIVKRKLDCIQAVKLTAIGLSISKELALINLEKILRNAKVKKQQIVLDIEGYPYVQDTFDIYAELFKKYKNFGVAIQAYLRRSVKDARRLARMGAIVRPVKGAYKEPKDIAFQKKLNVDEQYKKLLDILFDGCKEVHVGTHDPVMIDYAKQLMRKFPKTKVEFQSLLGIGSKMKRALAKKYKVRIYVPYGKDWIGYTYRRFRERKENWMFILKNLFR